MRLGILESKRLKTLYRLGLGEGYHHSTHIK